MYSYVKAIQFAFLFDSSSLNCNSRINIPPKKNNNNIHHIIINLRIGTWRI